MADPVRDARTRNVRELRQRSTVGETALWEALRGRRLDGMKFRRQRAIGQYVADFCCDGLKLIVEVDGVVHDEMAQTAP